MPCPPALALQGILQQAAVGSPGSAPGTPTAGGTPQQQQPDVRLVLPLMERVTTIFRCGRLVVREGGWLAQLCRQRAKLCRQRAKLCRQEVVQPVGPCDRGAAGLWLSCCGQPLCCIAACMCRAVKDPADVAEALVRLWPWIEAALGGRRDGGGGSVGLGCRCSHVASCCHQLATLDLTYPPRPSPPLQTASPATSPR